MKADKLTTKEKDELTINMQINIFTPYSSTHKVAEPVRIQKRRVEKKAIQRGGIKILEALKKYMINFRPKKMLFNLQDMFQQTQWSSSAIYQRNTP